MIQLQKKSDCVGCGACAQRCPKHCIGMQEDSEGFFYPHTDLSKCIKCGLCEKVCPVVNQNEIRKPIFVYAARNNNDEVRRNSSSGGVFTLLAEQIIEKGGVVFGAKFDKSWKVCHGFTESLQGISDFRGSKYVQSDIKDSYIQAEQFLKQGRLVLFSGTPCQIAGLNLFLRKKYNNLITADFICHGVPSPSVWQDYLKEIVSILKDKKGVDASNIINISFRDKRIGWKKFSLSFFFRIRNTLWIYSENKYKNVFLKGFLRDLFLRPSCYDCPVKSFKSNSDITIADFWDINKHLPQLNDHLGYSLCLVHNEQLNHYLIGSNVYSLKNSVFRNNISIYHSARAHNNREKFFSEYKKGYPVVSLIKRYATVPIKRRLKYLIASILKN